MIGPPQSETVMAARCNDAGEFFLEPDELLFTRRRVRSTNGIISMKANEPFNIIVANVAKVDLELDLRKGVTLEYAMPQRPA